MESELQHAKEMVKPEIQNQYDILKSEFLLCQGQMDKYDHLSSTIKTWLMTLWAASVGWALSSRQKEIFLIGAATVVALWFFDALNKTFRENYKKRRDEIGVILRQYFANGKLPPGTSAPQLPSHNRTDAVRNVFVVHIALPYILLVLISFVLYFKF